MLRPTLAALLLACIVCTREASATELVKQRPSHLPKAHPGQRDVVEIEGLKFYFGLTAIVNFFDAEDACQFQNMTLVSLQTAAKNDMIKNWLALNPDYDYWMWTSGYRPDSTWLWSATDEPFSFTQWVEGEPSEELGVEDCANFAGFAGGWDDDECNEWKMSYLCEEREEAVF